MGKVMIGKSAKLVAMLMYGAAAQADVGRPAKGHLIARAAVAGWDSTPYTDQGVLSFKVS